MVISNIVKSIIGNSIIYFVASATNSKNQYYTVREIPTKISTIEIYENSFQTNMIFLVYFILLCHPQVRSTCEDAARQNRSLLHKRGEECIFRIPLACNGEMIHVHYICTDDMPINFSQCNKKKN